RLVDHGQECDDVMPDPVLDLGDPGSVESRPADLRKSGRRNAAQGRPGLTRQNLYAKPELEPVLVGPDRPNRRRRVSLDQIGRRLPMNNGGHQDYKGRRSPKQMLWVCFPCPQDAVCFIWA